MADEEGLPTMLIPGFDPVEDGAVVFLGPTPEDAVPLRLIPEPPRLFLLTLIFEPERVSEGFDADPQLEPASSLVEALVLPLGSRRSPLLRIGGPSERNDPQHR